jgi:hypothetical protein
VTAPGLAGCPTKKRPLRLTHTYNAEPRRSGALRFATRRWNPQCQLRRHVAARRRGVRASSFSEKGAGCGRFRSPGGVNLQVGPAVSGPTSCLSYGFLGLLPP